MYTTIKGSIQRKDILMLSVNAPNSTTSKYMKQKLTELKEKDESTIMLADFHAHLSETDRITRQSAKIQNM